MPSDRVVGGAILAGSSIGVIVYGVLLYLFPIVVLEVTAFVGVVIILGILAWIGWTMATTPPPEPIVEPPATMAASSGQQNDKTAKDAKGTAQQE